MGLRITVCEWHRDCFSNRKGYCQCLNDTRFKMDCPFYKTKKQVEAERKATGYVEGRKIFSKKF